MKVYRIARANYINDLSGVGAKIYGGRWNPKGYALLYTAENKSLAALEVLVHLNRDTPPKELQIATILIPDKAISNFDEVKFRKILNGKEPNSDFKQLGKEWIISRSSLGMKIPSVMIPGEYNVILNPGHKLFKNVVIDNVEDFSFDDRLFK